VPERALTNNYFKHICSAYVFAYAFCFGARPLTDPDFWFHLKTGELILQTGVIPRTDPFSFTNFGKLWVAHEWLSGAAFYVIYSKLGAGFLIFVFAAITTLAFWFAFRRLDSHPFLIGLALLLSLWAIVPTLGVRPRVFTLLFTSIYLALLIPYGRRGKGRAVWWLVPIMILWVNFHGGFLIGLVLIGLALVGILLDGWTEGSTFSSLFPSIRTLVLVLIACLLVVILNPQGPRIYAFPFEIFRSPVQQELVSDWLSPDFHDRELLPLLLLILSTIGVLVLSPRRPKPSELLLFLVTLYATLKSSRHMAILALVAGPLLAEYLQSWLSSTSFGKPFSSTPKLELNGLTIVMGVVLLLPLAAFAVKLKSTVLAPPRQEVVGIPLKAIEFLKEKELKGNTFTDPNIWGDYLIWATPANPVYIDGRIDMYGDVFVRNYLDITWGVADWRAPFDRYGVRVAIVRPRSPLRRSLKDASDWQQVFEDDMGTVFVKR